MFIPAYIQAQLKTWYSLYTYLYIFYDPYILFNFFYAFDVIFNYLHLILLSPLKNSVELQNNIT